MKVIICGAGVVGAACAYYLSLRGAEITVVESIGAASAASGKSGGFLARDWCDGTPQEPLANLSYALHQELAGTLSEGYGYRSITTRLVLASERRAVQGFAQFPTPEWLRRDCAVANTLGDPENTAQLDPALFTRALLSAACDRGARIHQGSVQCVLRDPGESQVTGVRVDGLALHGFAIARSKD